MDNNPHLWKLSFKLIEKMTNNFSEERKLGAGAFGQVYKGVLYDGNEIAVKKLEFKPGIHDKQFQNEFENLKRLNHKNIVRLLGFCDEAKQTVALHEGKLVCCELIHRALCLEYMPNGSLEKLLSGEYLGTNWPLRYRIIQGICEGLKYLHEGLENPIYHLDLKPDNVLLDEEMVPKIADFGLSRLIGEENTKNTVTRLGTLGYLPPEFINKGVISKEYDIFSLGVIITKIIVGNVDYSSIVDMDDDHEIIDSVCSSWRKCLLDKPKYSSLETDCQQIRECIEIAVNCMHKDRHRRPKIKDIVSKMDDVEDKDSNSVWQMKKMQMQEQRYAEVQQALNYEQQSMLVQPQSQSMQLEQLIWLIRQPSLQQQMLTYGDTLMKGLYTGSQVQSTQAHRGHQEVSYNTSVVATAQTGHDFRDEIYEMVASLKLAYFAELSDLYNKISKKSMELLHSDMAQTDQYEKLKNFKIMLDRFLQFLQINKGSIQPGFREKMPVYEMQIIHILNSQRRKPVYSLSHHADAHKS